MSTKSRTVGRIVGVPEEQFGAFLKGVSVGMLAGTAMKIAGETIVATPAELEDLFTDVLRRNRDIPFYGLERPLSDEMIGAIVRICAAGNGRLFLNNYALQ